MESSERIQVKGDKGPFNHGMIVAYLPVFLFFLLPGLIIIIGISMNFYPLFANCNKKEDIYTKFLC